MSLPDILNQSVPAHFEMQVAQNPQRLAIKIEEQSISYDGLNQWANRIAHVIVQQLGVESAPVALLLTQGIPAIAAVLGVSKAHKYFVAIDPTLPMAKIAYLLANSNVRLILTDANQQSILQQMQVHSEFASVGREYPIRLLEEISEDEPSENLGLPITPEDYFQIAYTSGSTGQPKGVPETHRSRLHKAKTSHVTSVEDRISLTAPHLSGAIWTVCKTLLNGAALLLVDIKEQGMVGFADWLRREQITIYQAWPSAFRRFTETLQCDEEFPALRLVGLGGEIIYRKDIEEFKRCFPDHTLLEIAYSCTEAGTMTRWLIDKATELDSPIVPVGYPIPDKEIFLLDEDQTAVAMGTVGEIAVHSPYLAPGYWLDTELTAAKFCSYVAAGGKRIYLTGDLGRMRPDGLLEYIGRKDDMVKIRGYRVEVPAIESTLLELPTIKAAAVTAWDDANGNKHLVAYVVPVNDPPTTTDLRAALQQSLPDYMIPSHFITLDELPLLPNGKVNRKALPAPDTRRPLLETPYAPARNPLEAQLVKLWEGLLSVYPIGIYDDFFALGGHSLLAMSLMSELGRHFGAQANLATFFAQPTIAQLASLLADDLSQPTTASAFHASELSATQVKAVQELHEQLADLQKPQTWREINTSAKRSRRYTAVSGIARSLPFPFAYRLLQPLADSTWVRQRYFARQSALTQQFLALIDLERYGAETQAEALAKSMLCNWLMYYEIVPDSAQAAPKQTAMCLQVTGDIAIVEAAKAQGKGVILVGCHDIAQFYTMPTVLCSTLTLGGIQNYLAHYKITDATITGRLFSQQLNTARQVLQAGGVVKLFPDGHQGYSGGITAHIHGRQRPIWSSFAELALMTDVPAIAMMRTLDQQGQMQIRLTTLDPGDETMSHAERVEQLVSLYVALLRQLWAEAPWMVPWYQMERHLAYPPSKKLSLIKNRAERGTSGTDLECHPASSADWKGG